MGVNHQAGFLGFDRARRLIVGIQNIAVRQPVLATEDAAGPMAYAVAGGVADRRLDGFDDHLDDAAGPATVFPGAAGIGAELVAAEEQWEAHFGDFEAAELDAAGGLP